MNIPPKNESDFIIVRKRDPSRPLTAEECDPEKLREMEQRLARQLEPQYPVGNPETVSQSLASMITI